MYRVCWDSLLLTLQNGYTYRIPDQAGQRACRPNAGPALWPNDPMLDQHCRLSGVYHLALLSEAAVLDTIFLPLHYATPCPYPDNMASTLATYTEGAHPLTLTARGSTLDVRI